MITISKIELFILDLKLKEPFKAGGHEIATRKVLLCHIHDKDGVSAWSECVALETPHYLPETIDTSLVVFENYIAPLIIGQNFKTVQDVSLYLSNFIHGHYMAKAAIEMACWTIAAIKQNTSLATFIGGKQKEVATGMAIGLQDSEDILVAKVKKAVEQGYKKVKVKISPKKDIAYIAAIRDQLGYDIPVMVDANSAYSLDDIDHLKQFDQFKLMMIEQPFAWNDILQHRHLQEQLKTPICLDESIFQCSDVQTALEHDAARIINVKPGRVGGFSEAIAIHDYCQAHDCPVWCGGMLESGIGRAYNIALASLPNFSIPGDISPSDRYWQRDVIVQPWEMTNRGTIAVPFDKVGLGVDIDHDYIASTATLTRILT